MALAPGTRLGPYEVQALLGAGGMGAVYRACDSRLGRDVAIKLLPPHFIDDPKRRALFAREARLLATLNHPHIGAIYGLEEADGVAALVLEFVDGPTLADCLRSGPLSTSDALMVGSQIAEALEAAHEKGIIHRDLKPANIVVQGAVIGGGIRSRDLHAKVLDFGLAKTIAFEPESDEGQPAAETVSMADGTILGTPAYMSPEQARGLPVDKRTDVWAFGCVLFEMLTGHRAFGGTPADTLASVLTREPDWSWLPATTPEAVRRLLSRCLEKEPSHRLRDIGDARLELEEAAAHEPSSRARARRPRRLGSEWLALTLIGSVIILALATFTGDSLRVWFNFWNRQPDAPFELTRLTVGGSLQIDPGLSPDGHLIAYSSNTAGNFDIYTQPVGGGHPIRVTDHPAHDWQPDWSSAAQIVFRSERDDGGLYVVAPTGGEERRVAPFGYGPRWSPDGRKILFARSDSSRLYTVGLDGTPPRVCDSCYGMTYGWFQDARQVSLLTTGPQSEPIFRTVDLESGRITIWPANPAVLSTFRDLRLSIGRSALIWSPEGRAVYFTGFSKGISAVWRLEVDPYSRRLTGGPRRMATMDVDSFGLTIANATGTIAFAGVNRPSRIWWYPLDPSGRRLGGSPEALVSEDLAAFDHDVTPDGARLVFSMRRRDGLGTSELRLRNLDERTERTVRVSDTARGERRELLRLSPDGRRIVFRYTPPETTWPPEATWPRNRWTLTPPQQLRLIDLDTAEERELTTLQTVYVIPHGWSSDGRFVLATIPRGIYPEATGMAIGLLPIGAAPNAERQMKVVTRFPGLGVFQSSISPSGQWIAFEVKGESPRIAVVESKDGLWDQPQDESSWRYLEGLPGAYDPRWSADGRLLYYASSRGGFANVWAVDFDPLTGELGRPFQVTEFGAQGEQMGSFAVGPGRLAVRTVLPSGGIWLLHGPRSGR